MAVPLKQLLADSKRLVARDLFDPANAEVTFTISSNDLPSPSRPAGGRTFRGACRRLINVSPVLRYHALLLAKRRDRRSNGKAQPLKRVSSASVHRIDDGAQCERIVALALRDDRVRRPLQCACRTGTNSRDRRRGTRSNRSPALAHASRPLCQDA